VNHCKPSLTIVFPLYAHYIPGWWFGTFFIFHNIWDNPSHWLIFFRGFQTTHQISDTHISQIFSHDFPMIPRCFSLMFSSWGMPRRKPKGNGSRSFWNRWGAGYSWIHGRGKIPRFGGGTWVQKASKITKIWDFLRKHERDFKQQWSDQIIK